MNIATVHRPAAWGSGRTLPRARVLLELILGGGHHGTGPEIELLARRLRAAGIAAAAVRQP